MSQFMLKVISQPATTMMDRIRQQNAMRDVVMIIKKKRERKIALIFHSQQRHQ
jgi:hypothetical protein